MPSGFIQRFKGKCEFDPGSLWVGGQALYGGGSVNAPAATAALSTTTLSASGVSLISASTQQVYARLPLPPFPNIEKTIQVIAGTSGVFITLPAGGTFNGSTFNTVKTSTNSGVMSLVGTSTVNWAVTGWVTTTGVGSLTYSTST